MPSEIVKDPDAVLDIAFDITDWLADSEVVSDHTITVDGVTLDSDSETDGVITAWVSGGTNNSTASAECEWVTDQGRTDNRTMKILVRER